MARRDTESMVEPKLLEWARVSFGKTVDDAAKGLRFSVDAIRSWEAGETKPTISQAEKMAIYYKRPLALFYLSQPPLEKRLRDFRKMDDGDAEISSKIEMVRRRAVTIQEFASELDPIDEQKEKLLIQAKIGQPLDELAALVKQKIGFNEQEFTRKARTSEDAYRYWRNLLENSGILVLQSPFPLTEARAFSIYENGLRSVVVINTKDSINGRIFSLFHEICHILLRKTGICDMSDVGSIESYCNKFSAEFLVPMSVFSKLLSALSLQQNSVTDDVLESIAKKFRVSQQVIVLRLLAAGIVDQAFYNDKKEILERRQRELEDIKKIRDAKKELIIPQSTKCFAYNGTRFVGTVIDNYNAKKITLSDVVRYLDIGAKHVSKIQNLLSKGVKTDV